MNKLFNHLYLYINAIFTYIRVSKNISVEYEEENMEVVGPDGLKINKY